MVALGPTKAIREHCEITSSKRIYAADYQPDGVPFYRGKEIIEKHKGNLGVSTELFISETKFSEIKTKFGAPQPGDLLLTSVGTLGVPYVVKPGEVFYFKDGNLTWFRNFTGLDSRFLYYWLLSPLGKSELKKCTIGSSQSAFTIVLLKGMEIVLPSLPTQRKIVTILSTYDDLIENNTQRIKILEEIAHLIYREWFVDFRLPGHEKVKMVNSRLGKVPEGWEIISLSAIFPGADGVVLTGPFGSKLHASDYREQGIPLVLVKHVKDGQIVEKNLPLIGEHKPNEMARYRLNTGDIVVTRVGFVGETAYIHPRYKDWVFSGQTLRVRLPESKLLDSRYLAQYYLTDEFKGYIQGFAVGATRPSLNTQILSDAPILKPPFDLQRSFHGYVSPIDAQMQNLKQKNANLRRTRDMLLPKLISGEVDVENLRIEGVDDAASV